MSDKRPQGLQIPAILPFMPYVQESFDLNRMDAFVKSLGANFYHWKASPSPIGLNDKGDYRRNDGVDVITSNGYVYTFGGVFTATMTGNQKDQLRPGQGGLYDSSTANLIMPRFYNDKSDQPVQPNNQAPGGDCCHNYPKCECLPLQVPAVGDDCCKEEEVRGKRIYITPGDRLYHDPTINDLVVNKELMTFSYDRPNVPMFPIVEMDGPIIDSRGIYYNFGSDFNLCNGNIEWLPGRPNPGIDPDTGEGRTYSIRYLYRAFYYVVKLLREVRISEVTVGDVRRPERLPYFIQLQREFLYHNINNGNSLNPPPNQAMEQRQTIETPDTIPIKTGMIRVEQTDIDNDT